MKKNIEMAREASNTPIDHHATPDLFGINQIERFAELVRADERESTAKFFDGKVGQADLRDIAAAIRARGNA